MECMRLSAGACTLSVVGRSSALRSVHYWRFHCIHVHVTDIHKMNRDGYRDLTCNVDVSLHSKTHPLLMKYSNGTITQCYAYHYISELVSCAFSTIPICPFLIQRIFHSLVYILNFCHIIVYQSQVYKPHVMTSSKHTTSP